ncbi:MAG: hypothetical protein HOM33_01480 [Halieaceae bacterium]|jgi:hypothetical protein|nr:hypothetical protein [Halieaceae bacterium]
MEGTTAPLWFLAGLVALWLGFRLSHSMHEGAADSRAPLTARTLVTLYCASVCAILLSVAQSDQLPFTIRASIVVLSLSTALMQLLQIWTEKPVPGKDCQGRDVVE